ncbi:tRNA pseudouridine synthase B [Anopheles sinensis]|uniref:tRNA pseudouridine synthase B n=1 Tax=Anopheles sinensis TaxID=74873 RepID=A0A084W056_ANOSI|nr:tRNA pseudouridine synthase B [Anopheles sinensis]
MEAPGHPCRSLIRGLRRLSVNFTVDTIDMKGRVGQVFYVQMYKCAPQDKSHSDYGQQRQTMMKL